MVVESEVRLTPELRARFDSVLQAMSRKDTEKVIQKEVLNSYLQSGLKQYQSDMNVPKRRIFGRDKKSLTSRIAFPIQGKIWGALDKVVVDLNRRSKGVPRRITMHDLLVLFVENGIQKDEKRFKLTA